MLSWLYNFLPQPVLFSYGAIKIYWYGLLMVVALTACLFLTLRLANKRGLAKDHLLNIFFYLVIFGVIGARIYHVLFYNFSYFIRQPLEILILWHGGLAVHGSIISGILVVYFYTKKHHLNLWRYFDILTLVLPLGQSIGRWGNYFNQELFGRPCGYKFCIPISEVNRPLEYINSLRFHPLFLYEAFLNLVLFLFLYLIYQSKKAKQGSVFLLYLFGYSLIRFFTEFLRLDSSWTLGGLKLVQWFCILIFIVVLFLWITTQKKQTS